MIAHGSCRRFLWKLPHITRVPLDSTRVPHHITRVPLDSTVTAQECHPHQKGARSHHKGARSHKKGAIVIHFFRCPFRGDGANVSEMMMMMVKMMVEMIMQLVGPNQIMRCFLIALTSSTVDILRLLLHFLTRANCSRKVCEIEP